MLVAFAVCALFVPVAIVLSRRSGLIAQPGGRHAHTNPTPLLGGLAMYIGFAVAVVIFLPGYTYTPGLLVVSGLAAGLLIIDDRRSMSPWIKFAVQVFLSLLAVVVFGIEIKFFSLPGNHIVQLGLLVAPVSMFWLLGMQNTVNFLDGVDGLAAGVILIVAMILMLAAGELNDIPVVMLGGALAGTCGGFLLFNFHPARIFMGDSGAHFLGVALGMISILGVAKVAVAFALAVPVIALAVPIADTAWAIMRRRRQNASVATADLLHLHHRLQSFGLDPRQTCYVFYAASALLGALGLTLFGHGRVLAVVVVATAALVSTVVADLLLHSGLRIPAPFMRRLLGSSGSR
jgi:UDP-GlcNAc:undecaprenyl-phosphate GlcNAc-1-phosphate transferase